MASLLRRGRRGPAHATSTRSPAQAIVAAADPIDLSNDKARERARRKLEQWQAHAWEFVDELGEAGYASRYYGNAMSRLTLFVGVRPEPNNDPVPLDPKGDAKLGYSAEEAELAIDALARLDSPEGGKAELLRREAVCLFVPGECYLCGRVDEDYDDTERWDIYSTEELRPSAEHEDRWELARGPNAGGQAKLLPEDTAATRIWRPHPRISSWPDSPMRSALGICDELLTLRKSIKGSVLSRLTTAGWMPLPNRMRDQAPGSGEQEGEVDKIVKELIDVAMAGIEDPASAAARVPLISFVADDVYDMLSKDKFFSWAQEIDETAAQQREELIRAFANSIDLPPEIVTGKAALNEWGAWVVTEDVWKGHLEPTAILIVMALTAAYLTPYLREAGVLDPRRFVIWYDPAQLLTRPQRSEETRWAYEQLLISNDRTREELGYSDDDKPGPEEIELRLMLERVRHGRADVVGTRTPAPPPAAPRALPGVESDPSEGPEIPEAAPITGSATEMPGLVATLGRMESSLLADLHGQVEAHVRRVLERANSRLKSLAMREPPLKASVRDLTPLDLQVAPTLGPQAVQRLAKGEDLLEQLAAFRGRWDDRTERTADELLRLAVEQGNLSTAQAEQWRSRLEMSRGEGWLVLLAGLSALTAELLFRPEPFVGPGEVSGALVPPGTVRDALIAAGGGGGPEVSGMLSGAKIEEMWHDAGIGFDGWRWVYGDPSARRSTFEPHHQRDSDRNDGAIYTGPDDPRLQSPTWPYSLWPSDHHGCLCHAVRARVRVLRSHDAEAA